MTEMDDARRVPVAEPAVPRQGPVAEERAQVSWVMGGAVVVLLLMVPGAFVTGWRLGRTMGRLRGY